MTGLRGKLANEAGLTIVEVTVAAVVMVIGAIGVLGVTDAATRNTYRAEQSQVVSTGCRRNWSTCASFPSTTWRRRPPGPFRGQLNPGYRVNGTSFGLNRDGTDPQPLVLQRSHPARRHLGDQRWGDERRADQLDQRRRAWSDLRYVICTAGPEQRPNCKLGDLRR